MPMSIILHRTPCSGFRSVFRTDSSNRGFTIVELLIVVVVIAILAAIVMVAYNGIVRQAQNVETIANVRQAMSVIKMYVQDTNQPPLLGEVVNVPLEEGEDGFVYYPGAIVCLGEGYVWGYCGYKADEFDADNFDRIPEEPQLCQKLSAYTKCPMGGMAGSGRTVSVSYEGESFEFTNAIYSYYYNPDIPTDWVYYIHYMLLGNQSCGISGAQEYDDEDDNGATTYCYIAEYGGNSKDEWEFDW